MRNCNSFSSKLSRDCSSFNILHFLAKHVFVTLLIAEFTISDATAIDEQNFN